VEQRGIGVVDMTRRLVLKMTTVMTTRIAQARSTDQRARSRWWERERKRGWRSEQKGLVVKQQSVCGVWLGLTVEIDRRTDVSMAMNTSRTDGIGDAKVGRSCCAAAAVVVVVVAVAAAVAGDTMLQLCLKRTMQEQRL
jgi:hypothetical protein